MNLPMRPQYFGPLRLWLWCMLAALLALIPAPSSAAATTYYVSSSAGNDANAGTSAAAPLKTITKVNSLALQPGDAVLFKCGDTWRGTPLVITRSGTSGAPITFGAYGDSCGSANPLLSGAQEISGWSVYSGKIYVVSLTTPVNQLFRNGVRLTMGRWPNLDAGDGGYSTIDSGSGSQISDSALPSANWAGAVAHIRGMRWYILNRDVTARSGSTLTLGTSPDCWGGCTGWGYFLNNHLSTLDSDGEWFYDSDAKKLYLYSDSGTPQGIEGSTVLHSDTRAWGGVQLGTDLGAPISYVVIENLAIRRWFRHGIASPTNHTPTEDHDLTIRNNTIADVDGDGISLASWVFSASDGRPDGWRGGYSITISGNTISGANSMGIDSYSRDSTISGNSISDIALIANLGAAGMGCATNASGGSCTEDGDGIRIKIGEADDTGNNVTISGNSLARIGYNGMDIFGHDITVSHNLIKQACYAKGDCGAVRTFGRDSLAASAVYDLTFSENIIVDTIGNTDGCRSDYDTLFGFGLYIDNYSRDVGITGNTIISSTASGILYQNSTGSATDNTLYGNSAQANLTATPTYVSNFSGNVLYGLSSSALTLSASDKGRLGTSDQNYFFNPYRAQHISAEGSRTLASWQSYSGKDASSKEAWFSLDAGAASNSSIFYNASDQSTSVNLGTKRYLDLDQNSVSGSLELAPYRSQVLIYVGESADLALTLAAQGSTATAPSTPVTYTLTVKNDGALAAASPVLTHTIPAEIVGTSWHASVGGVSAKSGSRYVWTLPSVAAGAAVTITVSGTYTSTLEPGAPLALSGTVSTTTAESTDANNQALLQLGTWLATYLPVVQR